MHEEGERRAGAHGEVTSGVDLVGLDLLDQVLDDLHVQVTEVLLLGLTRLVERQVEEVNVLLLDTAITRGIARLRLANHTLDLQRQWR